MCITNNDTDLIEQYITSIPYGLDTLSYDTCMMDLYEHQKAKDSELVTLNNEDQKLLSIAFEEFEKSIIE